MDLFPYAYFNPIQTQIFWTLFHTDVCVLVGAPTGSGKTVAAELSVLRLLEKDIQERAMAEEAKENEKEKEGEKEEGDDEGKGDREREGGAKRRGKIVYIGPMKALVHERVKDWRQKFEQKLGLRIIELTGESSPSPEQLRTADILCTTPEKWDGTSRQV